MACAGCFEVEVGSALFVCLFVLDFCFPLSFLFLLLDFFFVFAFFLVTVETLDFFIKHPRPGSDGRDEGRTRATRTLARKDKEKKKKGNPGKVVGFFFFFFFFLLLFPSSSSSSTSSSSLTQDHFRNHFAFSPCLGQRDLFNGDVFKARANSEGYRRRDPEVQS